MSIENFLATVRSEGMMRTSRFTVNFALPTIFSKKSLPGQEDMRKVLLYCESTNLPSMSISTTEVRTYGEYRQLPYEKLFPNITLNFYVDNSMKVKLLFDNWISNIQDPFRKEMNYYDDFITDLTIKVGDNEGNSRYFVKLYECYPTAIGAVELSQSSREIMRISITMNYKNWISSLETSKLDEYTTSEIPNTYFTDFNSFQSSFNSLSNNINPFSSETAGNILGVGRNLI
jgi:hypothetical protein